MNQELNHLIEALRDELQQYGEMLVRLDRHHQSVSEHPENEAFRFSKEVQIQGLAIQRARCDREQASRELAVMLQINTVIPVEVMIPLLPEVYQSFVNELTRENRQLMD